MTSRSRRAAHFGSRRCSTTQATRPTGLKTRVASFANARSSFHRRFQPLSFRADYRTGWCRFRCSMSIGWIASALPSQSAAIDEPVLEDIIAWFSAVARRFATRAASGHSWCGGWSARNFGARGPLHVNGNPHAPVGESATGHYHPRSAAARVARRRRRPARPRRHSRRSPIRPERSRAGVRRGGHARPSASALPEICHPVGERPTAGRSRSSAFAAGGPWPGRQGRNRAALQRPATRMRTTSRRAFQGIRCGTVAPKSMARQTKSLGPDREQISDPRRNGGKTLAAIHGALWRTTQLVGWGLDALAETASPRPARRQLGR